MNSPTGHMRPVPGLSFAWEILGDEVDGEPEVDWWRPERTGCEPFDFTVGSEYAREALAMACVVPEAHYVPMKAFAAIARSSISDVERGFIGQIAKRAMIAALPPSETVDAFLALTPGLEYLVDVHRIGYLRALDFIELARALEDKSIVVDALHVALSGNMEQGGGAFIFTLCEAAILGSCH